MDTRPLAAPQAPAQSVRNAMRFDGTASEYFKIWIVNAALTIVTLGIFSAWAKVRSKRYLYGNTYLGAYAFDYHANPLRILLGRVIATALLLGYSLTATFAPAAVFGWIILFIVAFPWLIQSSLRFAARNTSFGNLRFDFYGTYKGAIKAFVLWQILAVVTLFIALPFSHRARDYYNINNHSFGQHRFKADISVKRLYLIYLLAPVILVGLGIVAAIMTSSLMGYAGMITRAAASTALPMRIVPALAFGFAYLAVFLLVRTIIGTMTFNLAVNGTTLGDTFRLQSRLSPLWMTWIAVTNALATLGTLGLLYPWARVRMARYMADSIAVEGPGDISDCQGSIPPAGGAVGEEVASFFDLDFGL